MTTMNKARVLIAEDEPLAADALAAWVRELDDRLELVAQCGDGDSTFEQVLALKPDLVLLDIQMPGRTGLQVLQDLRARGVETRVIFTTAYDEHAIAAFELHAADYLLKPFTQQRFVDAIDHALQRPAAVAPLEALEGPRTAAEPLQRILVRDQGRIVPVPVEAIEYLQADTKYTAIVTRRRHYLVRLPITAFEQRLDPARFMKISRAAIVNLEFVEAMTAADNSQYVFQLRDGARLMANREVSKRLREQSI
jgi:two-component system LytT family response regulator